MKKNFTVILILICVFSLFIISGVVHAVDEELFYVNSAETFLGVKLSDCFAIGSDGVTRLGLRDLFALSARGIDILSGVDYSGGGGLVSEGEPVEIKSNTIKVGLRYYFNTFRDSGIPAANLENAAGSGYAFGYFDEYRQFFELARTDVTTITMRPTSGTGIGVYVTGTDTLLYSVDKTSAASMLGIMPLSEDEEAITWFAANKYYGGFEYAVLGAGKISVINVVDIEKYTMGVCASEMNERWPIEALKAQAVAARTYGQKSIMNTTYYYVCGFDVTADTYCQAYSGCTNVGENICSAVFETEGEYLTYQGELIDALYFSSDGGATEDNENVNGNDAHPYLKGIIDPYEAKTDSINGFSGWTFVMTPYELGSKVGLNDVAEIDVTNSSTGNVIKLVLTSSNGSTVPISRDACRTKLGLYSINYDVYKNDEGNFVFEGKGWGHSLGMSQFGAYSMAEYYQKTYKDILGFYYTGVGLSYGITYDEEI